MDESSCMDISPTRASNRKRTRDDEDEAPLSPRSLRPVKRPATGMEILPAGETQFQVNAQTAETEDGGQGSNPIPWRMHDDWVNRTGNLRLDSPIPAMMQEHKDKPHRSSLFNNLATLEAHQTPDKLHYLPTPRHSPLAVPADTAIGLNLHGTVLLEGAHSHTPPLARTEAMVEEDSMMLSPTITSASPEKKRIVMGYRESCEYCRLRVPGHYVHYV